MIASLLAFVRYAENPGSVLALLRGEVAGVKESVWEVVVEYVKLITESRQPGGDSGGKK